MKYYRDPGNLTAVAPARRPQARARSAATRALCPCCSHGKLTLRYAAYPGARVASLRCYHCGCEWGLNPIFPGHRLRLGLRCYNGRRAP